MDLSGSSSEDEAIEEAILLALILRRMRRRKIRMRKILVRPIFRRRQLREYHYLLQDLMLSDADRHFSYMKMSRNI